MTDVSNSDDIIDSRDVIARIEELTEEREALVEAVEEASEELQAECNDGEGSDETLAELQAAIDAAEKERDEWDADYAEELKNLEALAEEASGYAPDWEHGEALIRETYFETYAQTLAEDIGAIPEGLGWPCTCIDWERAARELAMDYTTVTFDGVDYLIR